MSEFQKFDDFLAKSYLNPNNSNAIQQNSNNLNVQKKENNPLSYILNTPRPDFTQMHKENLKFEESMQKAQNEDRKKILKALHK